MIKKWADRIFLWYCDPECYDDIQGDLDEIYAKNRERSPRWSQWNHLWQVVLLFRPSVLKLFSQNSIINTIMINNYLKTGSRSLMRQKLFSLINIIGLAIGLAAFLVIQYYVRFERSYDNYYRNSDQLHRISTITLYEGAVENMDAMMTYVAPPMILEEYPEVLNYTTSLKFEEVPFKKSNSYVYENFVISADSNFLEMFDYPVIYGNKQTMLSEPNAIVMTSSKAKAYFGDKNPVGETLEISGEQGGNYIVTGVIEDVPHNTHYKFEMLISDPSLSDRNDYNSKTMNNYYSYLKLDKDADLKALNSKMPDVVEKIYGKDENMNFDIHPIRDIHLRSDFTYEPEIGGDADSLYFLEVIAYFILIIAWVNYVNLSTAKSVERAKEVGLRKVIGAHKGQLVSQFLIEAFIINFIAVLTALLIVEISKPYFNSFLEASVFPHWWESNYLILTALVFFLVGTFVSGFYPAIVLSSFKPIVVLKGKFQSSSSGLWLRKLLVIFQFVISIVMIGGTFIVLKQVNFMRNKDLGISTDHVIGINMPSDKEGEEESSSDALFPAFLEELQNHVAISSVGTTSNLPGGINSDINSTNTKIRIVGKSEWFEGTTFFQYNDYNFIPTVQLGLLAGRNFMHDTQGDSTEIIVNQAFLQRLNISSPSDVVNEYLQLDGDEGNKFQVVGVVKNFHRTSIKTAIEPTIYIETKNSSFAVAALDPLNFEDGLSYLRSIWSKHFPDTPLKFTFLDDRFDRLYVQDKRFGRLFSIFAMLAIIIAGLGLFGLTSYMAIQRTKEVGIRKVLGATIFQIVRRFFRSFIFLLAGATVISIPLIYYGMSDWLENFTEHISFPWPMVIMAVLLIVFISLSIVGFQVIKVAMLNPTKSLKHE